MPSRPSPAPWAVAVLGLLVEAVALIVATVGLARTAATVDGDDESNLGAAVFTELFGPFLYTVAAITVGVAALPVVLALAVSIRPGGRFTGLVVGVGAQVPVLGWSIWAVVDGEDPTGPLLAVLVGGAMVVLGALVPATWRWTRRPPVAVTP